MNNQEKHEMKKLYPPWYDGPPDPHVSLIHLRGPDGGYKDRWRCSDCGKEGTCTEMCLKGGCTYKQGPCKHCGYAPVCAANCPGIGEVLGRSDVYVAGFMGSVEQ